MREGKYINQVLKEFGELDEEAVAKDDPVKALMRVANHVAHEHPVRYERFRIRSVVVKGWRKLMGDFQDMRRSLREKNRLERERRRGLVIEIASWGVVIAALVALILFKVVP